VARYGTTVETPEGDSPGHTARDEPSGLFDTPPKPELGCQHIGGAGGKYTERDRGVNHSIHDLIDGAITTGGDDASRPPHNSRASDLTRGPRPSRGRQGNNIPGLVEQDGRALDFLAIFSLKPSRDRVID